MEIGRALRKTAPRLVFTEGGKTLTKVEEALEYMSTNRPPKVVVNSAKAGSHFPFSRLLAEIEPHFKLHSTDCDLNRAVFIVFTKGFTGFPKPVLLSERTFTLGPFLM